jgi:hypothetical protein
MATRRRPARTAKTPTETIGDPPQPEPTPTPQEPPRTEQPPQKVAPTREEIQRRAYDLYERRGGRKGSDLDDWLQAERDLS